MRMLEKFIGLIGTQLVWIMRMEHNLSYKVLMAMYEIEGGRIREGKRL